MIREVFIDKQKLEQGLTLIDIMHIMTESGVVKSHREFKQFLKDGAIRINGMKVIVRE